MKKAIIVSAVLALWLTRCSAEMRSEPSTAVTEQVVSNVSPADCFLCGDGAEEPFYWGQNNVGIISLNTFAVMPIVINRYDRSGAAIEKNTGSVQFRSHESQENGFDAHLLEDPDGGYARGEISFYGDETLDVEKTASFLCQDCLDRMLSQIHAQGCGVGVINFATREIRPFEACFAAFGLGDYYIDCNWKEPEDPADSQEVDILVFYHPPRYSEDE